MKKQICFSANKEVHNYLKTKSEKTGYSVSSIVNNIILNEMKAKTKKKQ